MCETQNSLGRRAFKLYNKVGATERDKRQAIALIKDVPVDSLDEYGKFLRAEIIFWQDFATVQEKLDAFDTFRSMSVDNGLPLNLVVGACFYAGRCYELGFATEHDFESALICYRAANKLNPKACLKDIARLEKALSSPQKINTATPPKFRFDGAWMTNYYVADRVNREDDIHPNFIDGLKTLKRTGFFYEDDPDEVEVDFYVVPTDKNNDK